MAESPIGRVTCARCVGRVDLRAPAITCDRCGQVFPRVGPIPVLLPRPDACVTVWREQLALLTMHGHHTLAAIEQEAATENLLPATRARLRALAAGVRDQTRELGELVGSKLGGPVSPTEATARSGTVEAALQHINYLYRDWGWSREGHSENQETLEAIGGVIDPSPLGRTLVLGAGACRLAYDLHRLGGGTETVVLDLDPFVFVIAEAIVRGASVELTESTANISEAGREAIRWTLGAPAGPLGQDAFHFVIANGLAPPFLPGSFDAVVTPWFIDQIPADLSALLATIARLLRPGGRWINHGPLIYPAEAPLSRRFSRDEVFDLAARAGFEMGRWTGQSRPYLVTPLNGRGKAEWVLTFEARLN